MKQLLPNVQRRLHGDQYDQMSHYIPYTLNNYKEKFDEKYIKLGGLGKNVLITR
jgi:hypothetical protein